MLYDNAQLARVYLHAWQITRDDFYRRVAEQTLDYIVREMTYPAGGFYSTQEPIRKGTRASSSSGRRTKFARCWAWTRRCSSTRTA